MSKRKDDPASLPDDENPEWTREEIRRARPAPDVMEEVFGATAAEDIRRSRGRPPKPELTLYCMKCAHNAPRPPM